MLVLGRRTGEEIVIAGTIRVTVVAVHGDRVRLGIDAPRSVTVDRKEIHDRRQAFDENEPALDGDGDPACSKLSQRLERQHLTGVAIP